MVQAQAHDSLGQAQDADQAYQRVLQWQPQHPQALLNRAHLALNVFGDPQQAKALVEPLWTHPHRAHEAELTTLMASLYDREGSALELNQRIIAFSRRHLRLPGWEHPRRKPRSLSHFKRHRPRVAILSPLLCVGPVYFLTIAGWRQIHPHSDIVVFHRGHRHDWATADIRTLSHEWHDVAALDASQLAQAIHDADIDVLYDLGGWMDPVALQALSVKPARLQYKWVGGQSVTTGLDSFDGWIGDDAQSPTTLQHLYTEPLIQVPGGYARYTPPSYLPAPAARKRKDPVIFSNPAKVSTAFLQHLRGLPGKKVFVHRQYQHPQARARIESMLPPHTVEYICPASHRDALTVINEHQTMLDTFPYSSGLTAREALAMGTRVVPHVGTLFCERHTAWLSAPPSANAP
jgi:predicted O-linked N-acetylglucosamine transferase (SPINDLY family)